MAIMTHSGQEAILFQQFLIVFLGTMFLKNQSIENGPLEIFPTQHYTLADAIFGCLQGVYWIRQNWQAFKPEIEKLANSASKYASFKSLNSVLQAKDYIYLLNQSTKL